MPALPWELLLLVPPLAVAAGLDLYLTLLVLGAASVAGWAPPLPGDLADLAARAALLTAALLYLLEFSAERSPGAGLVWNVLHAAIRPLSAALLALLLLDGQQAPLVAAGAVVAAGLAWLAHAARSGGAVLRWIDPRPTPHELLVSLLEDTLVLGLLTLMTDEPTWALAASVLVIALMGLRAPSDLRAFGFAIRLVAAWLTPLGERRWKRSEEMPSWIRGILAGDVMAPGGSLRGSSAGALRLPGLPRFATGWVVVRGDSPVFVSGRSDEPGLAELGGHGASNIARERFFTRVELASGSGGPACIVFPRTGPEPEALAAALEAPPRAAAEATVEAGGQGVEKNL